MTLSLAWIRRVKDTEELVFASDSRLRNGKAWDGCCKIFALARGDCALSFAGDTQYAYPMLHQVVNAIEMTPKTRSRALDVGALRGHIIRIFNDMKHWIHDRPKGNAAKDVPEVCFIFAGYSCVAASFKLWTIYYNQSIGEFSQHTRNEIAIEGDSIPEFKRRLHNLLRSKGKKISDGLNYEPFEVLRDMIREQSDPSIGGPPAILKVYKYMNTMPYSIMWPDAKSGTPTMLGRPLLEYESTSYLRFDPDALEPFEVPKQASRKYVRLPKSVS